MDENVSLIGDWGLPSPSALPKMLSEDNNVTLQMSEAPSENDFGSSKNCSGRLAERAGFNAPMLNTKDTRFTIPAGISPTTLLESPVFVSNSLAQPSPTTGKFPFISNGDFQGFELNSAALENSKDNNYGDYALQFDFNITTELGSICNGAAGKMISTTSMPQQYLTPEVSAPELTEPSTQNDNKALVEEPADEEGGQRGNGDSQVAGFGGTATPGDDPYNWRKYGQKQVKGSDFPRSYFKCTHTNCPVKKKVERSHEGHITEITYKGHHNHPIPPTNRRSAIGSAPLGHMQVDATESTEAHDGELGRANSQKGNMTTNADWKHENLEVTSSVVSVGPEFGNQSTNLQGLNGAQFESGDAVDGSSTFTNDEDDDDRGTHASVSVGYEGEGDELESKRRKLESYQNTAELSGATRAIREPRVVVQTTSEVDILDDGYRWRKYGQKVVKGNPNPRSYYKCTNVGCTVRKHVERASNDLKSVITTYEGKHNHDVPAARNSNQGNNAVSNAATAQASAIHSHRAEASQVHNGMGRLDRPLLGLGPFNLPGVGPGLGPGRPQLGPSNGFSFGIGLNQSGFPNLAGMSAMGPAHAKHPVMPGHSFLPNLHPPNMGFMLPKTEPNLESVPALDRGLNMPAGSSSVMMSRTSLGPQG